MITVVWEGGEHPFRLTLGGLRALQNIADSGPDRILRRIVSGDWRVDDLLGTVRLGLIGGGMAERDAKALVERIADQHPLIHFQHVAQMVLMDAITGVDDDPLGEEDAEPEKPEAGAATGAGGSPASTETAPS